MPPLPGPRPTGDGSDDARWKWGLFYINADDAALFVEQRFGLGYTINLGNPLSWVLLGGLVVLPIVIALVAIP